MKDETLAYIRPSDKSRSGYLRMKLSNRSQDGRNFTSEMRRAAKLYILNNHQLKHHIGHN